MAAGGKTRADNLCLACPSCNRYKAAHQTAVDPVTSENIALFHPRSDTWEKHFRWAENSSILEGLSPTGRATLALLRLNRPQLVNVRKLWVKLGEHPPF